MLNQVPVDLGVPFISDPQNLPVWANYLTVFLEREWANMSGRINSLLPNDGSEGKAWTQYTPTITTGSGTLTSFTTFARYYKVGRVVFIMANVNITTNGTAAGNINISLPFTATSENILAGREDAVSGKMLQGIIRAGANIILTWNYDNTYPGANGANIFVSGMYESTT